jgi:hypothetical protein
MFITGFDSDRAERLGFIDVRFGQAVQLSESGKVSLEEACDRFHHSTAIMFHSIHFYLYNCLCILFYIHMWHGAHPTYLSINTWSVSASVLIDISQLFTSAHDSFEGLRVGIFHAPTLSAFPLFSLLCSPIFYSLPHRLLHALTPAAL